MAFRTIHTPPRVAIVDSRGNMTQAFIRWLQEQVRLVLNQKTDGVPSAWGKFAEFGLDGNLVDSERTKPLGAIVGTTDAQTLSLKVLDVPDIADFHLANHTHTAVGDGGVITEDSFVFDDVTTNNSTTTKHGLLQKLSGNASEFLAGDGSWGNPGGTSGGDVGGGTFTLDAAVSTTVSDSHVTANSRIVVFAKDAAAAAQLIYESGRSAGNSFTVSTASGAAAAGTETYQYVRVN